MNSFYVVGGRQRKGADLKKEWHRMQAGIVLQVDIESGEARTCIEYVSPSAACAGEDAAILFKLATMENGNLYVPTQTEILVYTLPDFRQINYISLPCFNDLHHVRPTREGNLLVVNTGLDMVVEVSSQGELLRQWSVLDEEPWARFSRDVDYRKLYTTKPHLSHPNYVFLLNDEVWVTRFEQKDAICLTQPGRRIDIGVERPHDGIVHGTAVYFTTVDGHVVVANSETLQVEKVVNLREIDGPAHQVLGWCRGIKILDDDLVVVGFSRLRPTQFMQNVRWVGYHLGATKSTGAKPSRIALYDLKRKALIWERNVEDHGLNTIFSIHGTTAKSG